MLVGELKVILNSLLPDHLLDLALRIHVERIFVEQPHLLLPLALAILVLPHHALPHFSKPCAVVDRLGKCRSLRPHLRHRAWVAQYAQPRRLNLMRTLPLTSPLRRLLSPLCAHSVLLIWLAHEHS